MKRLIAALWIAGFAAFGCAKPPPPADCTLCNATEMQQAIQNGEPLEYDLNGDGAVDVGDAEPWRELCGY